MEGPPAHPPEPAYPCCLPALGRFAGWSAARGVGRRVYGPVPRRCAGRILSAEDSPSGLWRSPGTRVGGNPSGVQIPYPPPTLRHASPVEEPRATGPGALQAGARSRARERRGLVAAHLIAATAAWSSPPGDLRQPVQFAEVRRCSGRADRAETPRRASPGAEGVRCPGRRGASVPDARDVHVAAAGTSVHRR